MFLAQLAQFLTAHHHAQWVPGLFGSAQQFAWLVQWATHHGFRYQP